MLNAIIVVLECISSIIWRIDVDTFDFAGEILLQGFEREQVIAMDKHIFRFWIAEAFGWILDQDSGLKFGLFVLTDPGEFETLGFWGHWFMIFNVIYIEEMRSSDSV